MEPRNKSLRLNTLKQLAVFILHDANYKQTVCSSTTSAQP